LKVTETNGTIANGVILTQSCDPIASGIFECLIQSSTEGERVISLVLGPNVSDTKNATKNIIFVAPAGIDLEVPIELTDHSIRNATSDKIFERTMTRFNPLDYEAYQQEIYFEVTGRNTKLRQATDADNTPFSVYLVNESGVTVSGAVAPVPVGPTLDLSGSAAPTIRVRVSVPFTSFVQGEHKYRLKLQGSTYKDLYVFSARLIVKQTLATKTKLYFPLLNAAYALAIDETERLIYSTPSNTYTGVTSYTSNTAGDFIFNRWPRNDLLYTADSKEWTLEAVIANDKVKMSYVALHKSNTTISASEVSSLALAGGTIQNVAKTFTTDPNFTDNANYHLRIKAEANTARLYKAGLWLKLVNPTKARIYNRIGLSNALQSGSNSSQTMDRYRFLWTENSWSNPVVGFETYGREDTHRVQLINNTNSNIYSSVAADQSVVYTTPYFHNTTIGFLTSPPLTLVNGANYIIKHSWGSISTNGEMLLYGSFITVDVD